MKCSEAMNSELATLAPSDTVKDAARKMQRTGVGFLPVCTQDGKPVGAVTDRDLVVRVMAEDWSSSAPVVKAMTGGLLHCKVNQGIEEAMDIMRKEGVSRVVCVNDDGIVAGVISLAEMAQHMEISEAMRAIKWP